MLYVHANIIKLDVLYDVSSFVDIDQLIARVNALVAEDEERQKRMENLKLELYQLQEELENYYVLSREQSKVLELNEKLLERVFVLLKKGFL